MLIHFIESAHTARTYYSKVRNRPTFSKKLCFNYFFTAHAYFKPELLMIPYAFRIYCNNIILNFTKMLLLRTLEYDQLVLCEVSRYVKKWLRKTPQKIKLV